VKNTGFEIPVGKWKLNNHIVTFDDDGTGTGSGTIIIDEICQWIVSNGYTISHYSVNYIFYEINITTEGLVFLKLRWPEIQTYHEIMKNARMAYWYARDIIGRRWPEAEPYIMQKGVYAYYYARYIIKGRWPEAEPYLMQKGVYAYYYAKYVIKGRWPEAEPYLMHSKVWPIYATLINLT